MNYKQKIGYFLTVLILLHAAMSGLFFLITSKTSELVQNQQAFEQLKKAPKYLFLGDSHPTRAINENKIEGSYKLSFYGEGLILGYYRLKYVLENLQLNPEYVFLQTDISRFSTNYFSHSENKFFYNNYVNYDELLNQGVITYEQYMKYLAYRVIPYLELKSVVRKNKTNKIKKGLKKFSDLSELEKQNSTNFFIKDKLLSNNPNNLYYDEALNYLVKTIELCHTHQVKIIAIKYPVTDYYLNVIAQFCGKEMLNNPPQDKILLKYNIPIWNFEEQFLDKHNYFFDAHHINEFGREAFTVVLKKRMSIEFNEK
jgi:hypothetical protein